MLLRLAYLSVTNAFAMLRLLPMSDREKDVEILALRHQITVLERQLGGQRVRFDASDRAFLAALLHRLSAHARHRMRLLIRPDTVLRWHRDLMAGRHATRSRPKRGGRPRTVRSIRVLALRLAAENPGWGYRRLHGELLVLGVKVAASTVWEILKDAGIPPSPERASTTWADFLRSQADALLLGRKTWQSHGGAFEPMAGDPFGEVMNNIHKYVVSTTLKSASAWRNSTLIRDNVVEAIRQLKQQPGKNIGITGSVELVRSLIRAGVLDELNLLVHPILIGHGKRLFDDMGEQVPLKLADSKTFSTGVLQLTYVPADK